MPNVTTLDHQSRIIPMASYNISYSDLSALVVEGNDNALTALRWYNKLAPYQSEHNCIKITMNTDNASVTFRIALVWNEVVPPVSKAVTVGDALETLTVAIDCLDHKCNVVDWCNAKDCIARAATCITEGDWEGAQGWALESISYSAGFNSNEYNRLRKL